jgi:DNA-binding SARP family transcriptional activator
MDRLNLSLFGGFQARSAIGHCVPVPTEKGRALLSYLACHPNESHPRGKLATLLWPNTQDSNARHSLRQTLCVVRASLTESAPTSQRADSDSIALDAAHLFVDVVAFERLTRDGTPHALADAGDLYRGDLLAGISVKEPPFEDWLRLERERLRDLAVEGLAKLIVAQRQAGLIERAVQSGHPLLRFDPAEEIVHRTLMRLYASLGRLGAVRRQYQACVEALRRELDASPSSETTRLLCELTSRP